MSRKRSHNEGHGRGKRRNNSGPPRKKTDAERFFGDIGRLVGEIERSFASFSQVTEQVRVAAGRVRKDWREIAEKRRKRKKPYEAEFTVVDDDDGEED